MGSKSTGTSTGTGYHAIPTPPPFTQRPSPVPKTPPGSRQAGRLQADARQNSPLWEGSSSHGQSWPLRELTACTWSPEKPDPAPQVEGCRDRERRVSKSVAQSLGDRWDPEHRTA